METNAAYVYLDDGVKHNYEIFKDVLAKIK